MGTHDHEPSPLPAPDRRLPDPDRRRATRDRRGAAFRGGRRASDIILAAALAGGGLAARAQAAPATHGTSVSMVKVGRRATDGAIASREPMRFGVDMPSVGKAESEGLSLSYGAFWVGPWTQKDGWSETDRQLAEARRSNVVPVVNWWYWGDDISPKAVESGIDDRYHHVHKDRASWTRMSEQLADRIARGMGGRETIVVLETEFNKNGMDHYAPFDKDLADQIRIFHARPGIKVVLGLGNWGRRSWGNFSEAIASSDLLGIQLLQSSVHDSASYAQAPETLVSAARYIHTQFHKPSLVVDLGLSSYGPHYEESQKNAIAELFERLPEMKAAGVEGIIWRAVADNPRFDTANYHGEAERHWGLLRADGSAKPAFAAFTSGVRAETARSAVAALTAASGVARTGTP
jgi:hypothetical protein